MARAIHRESADKPFMVVDAASDLEARLLDAAVSVLGDELAVALDEGRLIDGNTAMSQIDKVVEIVGKQRRVRLTFTLENA